MLPHDDDQDVTPTHGLKGAGGVAGDPGTEPDDAPTHGSDADETSLDSASPAGIAESLTESLTAGGDEDA